MQLRETIGHVALFGEHKPKHEAIEIPTITTADMDENGPNKEEEISDAKKALTDSIQKLVL